jgi:hypothetical protein
MGDFGVRRFGVNNWFFAAGFRAFGLLFTVWGVLTTTGALKNAFDPVLLLAYTIQSNILVAMFFGVLLAKTLLKKNSGKEGPEAREKPYGFFPRLSMCVALAIFVTMVVYWAILVPASGQGGFRWFLALNNLAVHLITPLLMIADYLMFTKRGLLKKYDPLLGTIIPFIYLLEVLPLGFSHTVRYDSLGNNSYYPYIFLDVDRFGARVILMVAGMTLFFLVIAFIWRRLDNKLGRIAASK